MKKIIRMVLICTFLLTGCGSKEADISQAVTLNYTTEGISFNFNAKQFLISNKDLLGTNAQNMVTYDNSQTVFTDNYNIALHNDDMNSEGIIPYSKISNDTIPYETVYNEEEYNNLGIKLPANGTAELDNTKLKKELEGNIGRLKARIKSNKNIIENREEEINKVKTLHTESLNETKNTISTIKSELKENSDTTFWTEEDLKRYQDHLSKLESNEYAVGTNTHMIQDKSSVVTAYSKEINDLKKEIVNYEKNMEDINNILQGLK